MNDPLTSVNGRVTDAITQVNALVIAQSPAMAMASLYQNLAQATALATMNAVFAQQQTNILFQITTASSVKMLLGLRK